MMILRKMDMLLSDSIAHELQMWKKTQKSLGTTTGRNERLSKQHSMHDFEQHVHGLGEMAKWEAYLRRKYPLHRLQREDPLKRTN